MLNGKSAVSASQSAIPSRAKRLGEPRSGAKPLTFSASTLRGKCSIGIKRYEKVSLACVYIWRMKAASAQVADIRMQKVDGYHVDDNRPAQSDAMNSGQFSLPPVAVPVRVRWREFRIQVLPLLAFGVALLLSGLLWHRTVIPTSVDPPHLTSAPQSTPAVANPVMEQAAHAGTNGMAKAPPD